MVRTPHAHASVLGGTGKSVCVVVPLIINDNCMYVMSESVASCLEYMDRVGTEQTRLFIRIVE